MMRFAALQLDLMPSITEEELRTLREGDKVLLPVEFVGWRRCSTDYGIAKEIAIVRATQIKTLDRTLTPAPEEIEVFGAQLLSTYKVPIEKDDLVRSRNAGGFALGKVIALEQGFALIRSIRPASDIPLLEPIEKVRRTTRPRDLTEAEHKSLA